jgi:hypothetical protein
MRAGGTMNPTEQAGRHTAIGRVNERIDTLAAAVDSEVAEQSQALRQLIARLLKAEHTERVNEQLALRAVQLDASDALTRNATNIVAINFYLSQFIAMTFRERLRWMVLGRLPAQFSDFADDPESILFLPPPSPDTNVGSDCPS